MLSFIKLDHSFHNFTIFASPVQIYVLSNFFESEYFSFSHFVFHQITLYLGELILEFCFQNFIMLQFFYKSWFDNAVTIIKMVELLHKYLIELLVYTKPSELVNCHTLHQLARSSNQYDLTTFRNNENIVVLIHTDINQFFLVIHE